MKTKNIAITGLKGLSLSVILMTVSCAESDVTETSNVRAELEQGQPKTTTTVKTRSTINNQQSTNLFNNTTTNTNVNLNDYEEQGGNRYERSGRSAESDINKDEVEGPGDRNQ